MDDLKQNRLYLSAETFMSFFIDVFSVMSSPFILHFLVEAMAREDISNAWWVVPLFILLIIATYLDNKTVPVNDYFKAKGKFIFFLLICAVIYAIFFISVSLGVMGIFNAMGEEEGMFANFLIFFIFIIGAFFYAGVLLSPALGEPGLSIAPPQKIFYLSIALVPIATNIGALFFVAFWDYKLPVSTEGLSTGLQIMSILPVMAILILFCGVPRLMLLLKRYSHLSLAGFLLFYLFQAAYFVYKF